MLSLNIRTWARYTFRHPKHSKHATNQICSRDILVYDNLLCLGAVIVGYFELAGSDGQFCRLDVD